MKVKGIIPIFKKILKFIENNQVILIHGSPSLVYMCTLILTTRCLMACDDSSLCYPASAPHLPRVTCYPGTSGNKQHLPSHLHE